MSPGESRLPPSLDGPRARRLARFAAGLALGVVPLLFVGRHLFYPGYPYPGDGTSNLLPALHVRWALSHGQLPLYTHLWYGGEYVLFNPLFKGFYPPAWPLFVPGVPLLPATKVLLGVHYVATPVIAYWFAREDFPAHVAVVFALLFTIPMALFVGHYEKVFGWPWFVLIAWQVTPPRLFGDPRRAGLLAGVGLGALLLAGDNYHFFHAGVLLGCVVLATKARAFLRRAALGALVGAPKVVFSILPVFLLGTDRPTFGRSVSFRQFVAGLVGFWPDTAAWDLEVRSAIFSEGYAVVGLGAVLVAGFAVGHAYLYEVDRRWRGWVTGVAVATAIGVLLATRWSFLYALPLVSTFRASARAMVLVAIGVLLLCWYGASVALEGASIDPGAGRPLRVAVVALLLLSVVNGVATWSVVADGGTVQTDVDTRVADRIETEGCSSVWFETSYPGAGGAVRTPYEKQVAFELTRRGVPIQAVNYGRIGQEYATHEGGELTFDALVVGVELPAQGEVILTGGWNSPSRGTVDSSRLTLLERYDTDEGSLYLYTTGGCG